MTTEQLARLTPHDREEVLDFQELLREAGPLRRGCLRTEDGGWKDWVTRNPEAARIYLGVTEDQAKKWGWPEEEREA